MNNKDSKYSPSLIITLVSIYTYALTILGVYGFSSFYGIPPSFIEASLRANIIYLYSQVSEHQLVATNLFWLILILILATIAVLIYLNKFKKTLLLLIIVSAIFLLPAFLKFGTFRASHQLEYLVPGTDCPVLGPAFLYVAPIIYDGKAIFIPLDEQNKMQGGFLVKDISEMGCTLIQKYVGEIK